VLEREMELLPRVSSIPNKSSRCLSSSNFRSFKTALSLGPSTILQRIIIITPIPLPEIRKSNPLRTIFKKVLLMVLIGELLTLNSPHQIKSKRTYSALLIATQSKKSFRS
jgi:hypothetical protein